MTALPRILVDNGLVLTMDAERRIIPAGRVLIEGRDIVAVGPADAIPAEGADLVLDATGRLVMPGLVNAHTHLCMTFGRTLGPERRLMDWLDLLMPFMAAMDSDALYLAELLGCVENLKNGNTTLVENIFMPPAGPAGPDPEAAAFRAMRDSGVRGTVARGTHARNALPAFCESADEQAERVRRLAGSWNGAEGGRLALSIGRILPWVMDAEEFRATRALATECGLPLHMHVAENADFHRLVAQHVGRPIRNVEFLDEVGCLGPDVQAVACADLSRREIELLAETGTNVVFDPPTRLFWGTGFAPIRDFLDSGLTCGLASNGCAANCGQDIFESMKYACATAKTSARDPRALTASRALAMATHEGARAIGRPDIGVLEPGRRADLITVEMRQPHLTPLLDPEKALVYAARAGDVRDAIVDGRLVMREREVLTVDEAALLVEAEAAARRCAARAGLALPHGPLLGPEADTVREPAHA